MGIKLFQVCTVPVKMLAQVSTVLTGWELTVYSILLSSVELPLKPSNKIPNQVKTWLHSKTPTPVNFLSPTWIKFDLPMEPIELLNSEPTSKKLCKNMPLSSEMNHFFKKVAPNLLMFTKDFTISKLSTEAWYGTLIWLKLWNSKISCFVLDRLLFLLKLGKNLEVLMPEKITKIGLMNTTTLNHWKVKN